MKTLTTVIALAVATTFLSCDRQRAHHGQTINPLIGDISFISKFGQQPTATTDEDLRIKTHLEYVENLLRQKDVSDLTAEQIEKRNHLLDLLHTYRTAGIFPRNYDYKGTRQPCFIDKNGRICAVGYLVEQTAGRQTAKQINDNHKYDNVLAMNDNSLDSWIKASGLTKEECAMIQPGYGPPPGYNYNYIDANYGLGSAVLGGLNLSLNTINAIQISKGTAKNTVAVLSILSGVGSIVYGGLNFPKDEWSGGFYPQTNESKKALSLINIGIGTSAMTLGMWNLWTNKNKKSRTVAWNFYSFPTAHRQPGLGLCFTKKL
jgi:hypothetical protein